MKNWLRDNWLWIVLPVVAIVVVVIVLLQSGGDPGDNFQYPM